MSDHQGLNPCLRLVHVTGEQRRLAGLSSILKTLAESAGADGCVLWERTSLTTVTARSLFVLADYATDPKPKAWHYLSTSSETWQAIQTGEARFLPAISDYPEPDPADLEYLKRMGYQAGCALPISLRRVDRSDAAVNFYWRQVHPLDQPEQEKLRQLASIIPDLYASLVDHAGFDILKQVSEQLLKVGRTIGPLSEGQSLRTCKAVLTNVVRKVARAFNAVEATIYLNNPTNVTETCELMALKWGWSKQHQPPTSYLPGDGLTGYSISHGVPVRVFDLGRWQQDLSFIQEEYPGIEWSKPIRIEEAARQKFELGERDVLPPLSFMSVPISYEGKGVGAIRCCTTRTGPHFYDDRQVQVLQLVADQIGAWWGNLIAFTRADAETHVWKTLVQGFGELNEYVHKELSKPDHTEGFFLERALALGQTILPASDILSIRLVDWRRRELRFMAKLGPAWETDAGAQTWEHSYALDSPAGRFAGVDAFNGLETLVMTPGDMRGYTTPFPGVRHFIVTPVRVGNEAYGTLELRSTGTDLPPRNAVQLAELLARQIGLFHLLALRIRDLLRVQEQLGDANAQANADHRTLEDFEHQIKGPIFRAFRRAEAMANKPGLPSDLKHDVQMLRSFCRQATLVAGNMRLHIALSKGTPFKPAMAELGLDAVETLLRLMTADQAVQIDPDRHVRFEVGRDSFHELREVRIKADSWLLEQAAGNLLDNAAKYSYSDTTVSVSCGLTAQTPRRFYIAVCSQGPRITSDDVRYLGVTRGYRTRDVQAASGEGQGIGLWLADRTMAFQSGALEVIPTDAGGMNQFRLLFPVQE